LPPVYRVLWRVLNYLTSLLTLPVFSIVRNSRRAIQDIYDGYDEVDNRPLI